MIVTKSLFKSSFIILFVTLKDFYILLYYNIKYFLKGREQNLDADEPYDFASSSSAILESARKIRLEKQRKRKAKTRDKLAEFMSADVHDSELGIIPEGYGGISYLTFLIFAPWIAGIIFMFFYVAGGDTETFNKLEDSTLLTWVIGYEMLAALILLLIFKKLVVYILSK